MLSPKTSKDDDLLSEYKKLKRQLKTLQKTTEKEVQKRIQPTQDRPRNLGDHPKKFIVYRLT